MTNGSGIINNDINMIYPFWAIVILSGRIKINLFYILHKETLETGLLIKLFIVQLLSVLTALSSKEVHKP